MEKAEPLLMSIADGMKTIAAGMYTIAEQLRKLARAQEAADQIPEGKSAGMPPSAKTAPSLPPAPESLSLPEEPSYVTDASGKVVTKLKKAASRKKKSRPATDIVLNVIQNSDGGTNNQSISAKTGFDKKKIANILFQLKKAGKIEPVSRGFYKAV